MCLLTGDVTGRPPDARGRGAADPPPGRRPRPARRAGRPTRPAGGGPRRRLSTSRPCRVHRERAGRESVHRVRVGVRRRAGPVRATGGGPGARLAQCAPGHGASARRSARGLVRLHVRIDERSASFLALGLAKASRRPVAAVHLGDRGGELPRGRDRGRRVRRAAARAHRRPASRDAGDRRQPDDRPGQAVRERGALVLRGRRARGPPGVGGYWRSLACRAWAGASGGAGGFPGPVHVNMPLREPLVPGAGGGAALAGATGRPARTGAPWAGGSRLRSRAGMALRYRDPARRGGLRGRRLRCAALVRLAERAPGRCSPSRPRAPAAAPTRCRPTRTARAPEFVAGALAGSHRVRRAPRAVPRPRPPCCGRRAGTQARGHRPGARALGRPGAGRDRRGGRGPARRCAGAPGSVVWLGRLAGGGRCGPARG